MKRISSFYVVAIAILFSSQFCTFGHEIKSASAQRLSRLMNDEQQSQKKSNSESKNDNIVFEPENMYTTKTTERTLNAPLFPPLLAIRSNPHKSNETNHQYSGKANGEYEFR